MALPTLTKVWQFSNNNALTVGATAQESQRKLMFKIKQILVGFTTLPWTVVASSNGVVANSSDNWNALGDVVFGSGSNARSWIVLKQTGIASNFQILIAANNGALAVTDGDFGLIRVSPSAGFTSLTSTTANPSATDVYTVNTNNYWSWTDGSAFASVVHGQQSNDGECTRIVVCVGGASKVVYMFEKLKNPVTGMTNPTVSVAVTNVGGGVAASVANLVSATTYCRGMDVATTMDMCMTTEVLNANVISFAVANEICAAWPLVPVGVASTTVGKRGRHGNLQDAWFGSTVTASVPDGSTYPNDTTRQFAQFGILVLPWDGSVVTMT